MKVNQLLLTTTLVLGTAASLLVAQPQNQPPTGTRPTQGQRPPQQRSQASGQSGQQQSGGPGGQRPAFPLVDALDVNKDHIIDAAEMANAVAALKKLDKNGDGKLTPDEYLPARPGGQSGQRPSAPPGGDQNQGQPPQ